MNPNGLDPGQATDLLKPTPNEPDDCATARAYLKEQHKSGRFAYTDDQIDKLSCQEAKNWMNALKIGKNETVGGQDSPTPQPNSPDESPTVGNGQGSSTSPMLTVSPMPKFVPEGDPLPTRNDRNDASIQGLKSLDGLFTSATEGAMSTPLQENPSTTIARGRFDSPNDAAMSAASGQAKFDAPASTGREFFCTVEAATGQSIKIGGTYNFTTGKITPSVGLGVQNFNIQSDGTESMDIPLPGGGIASVSINVSEFSVAVGKSLKTPGVIELSGQCGITVKIPNPVVEASHGLVVPAAFDGTYRKAGAFRRA